MIPNYVVSHSENNNISNNGLIVKLKTPKKQPIDSFQYPINHWTQKPTMEQFC